MSGYNDSGGSLPLRKGEQLLQEEDERSVNERAFERLNVRAELDRYGMLIEELKIQYEQHFSSILAHPPDKLHNDVKRMRRLLASAPFKNSEHNFRFQTLEHRYSTYRSYWERVQREREAGTYQRDIFKAEIRAKNEAHEQYRRTDEGRAVEHFDELYRSYCSALQELNGKKIVVDKGKFRETVLTRAKELQARRASRSGKTGEDLSFSVEIRSGKVRLVAQQAEKQPAKKPNDS